MQGIEASDRIGTKGGFESIQWVLEPRDQIKSMQKFKIQKNRFSEVADIGEVIQKTAVPIRIHPHASQQRSESLLKLRKASAHRESGYLIFSLFFTGPAPPSSIHRHSTPPPPHFHSLFWAAPPHLRSHPSEEGSISRKQEVEAGRNPSSTFSLVTVQKRKLQWNRQGLPISTEILQKGPCRFLISVFNAFVYHVCPNLTILNPWSRKTSWFEGD